MQKKKNIDEKVVNDFGKEWNRFNHLEIDKSSLQDSFEYGKTSNKLRIINLIDCVT